MLDIELLNGIKGTIGLHNEELRNEPNSINDFIIEDLLEGLGYNKRKDPTVKRLYSDRLTWRIANHIGIMITTKNNTDDIQIEFKNLPEFDCDILMVVNHDSIFMFRYTNGEFKRIYMLNLTKDLTKTDIEFLDTISKDKTKEDIIII